MGPDRGKKGAKGGGKGSGGGNHYKQANYYSSKRPVGGKGIFITTIRGKESRCAGEAYDLLDEVADRLYPPERIQKMQEARMAWIKAREDKAPGGAPQDLGLDEEAENAEMDDDDEEKEDETPAPPPAVDADSDSDDEEDLDIEASIQRELADLKAGHGGQVAPSKARRSKAGGGGEDQQEQKKVQQRKERPRFQSIKTDTECLCFIATAWPYDPVELTEAIVAEVQETGQSRTRYVQRLSPLSFSCHSLSVDQVELQSSRLIEQVFTNWAAENGTTSVTYAIEPSVRSHTAPLSRSFLLPLLGSLITSLSSAPRISSPCPTRPILQVRADLKNPDLVLLPTVLRNVYGLSIVKGNLWKGRGKKFNVAEIAAMKRAERVEEVKGEGGSVVTEMRAAAEKEAEAASKATTTPTAAASAEPRSATSAEPVAP
ncbi:hypothetical protein JCM10908_002447 [Rhodotorula pacifica]|uniref:putative tRNA acetyltransferase n=1 Tax=Rhodotorula pacifica TaxID=1495444 RepID=UPI003173C8A0